MSTFEKPASASAQFINQRITQGAVRGTRGTLLRKLGIGASAAGVALLLAACGGGNGSSGTSTPVAPGIQVPGEAVKGLVRNGVINVYAIVSGARQTTAIATGSTNDAGAFVLEVPAASSGPAIIEVTPRAAGSTPVTTVRCDHPAGCGVDSAGANIAFGADIPVNSAFMLRAAVPDIKQARIEVSVFSDLAAAEVLAGTSISADSIRAANSKVRDTLGLTEDVTQIDMVDIANTRDLTSLSGPVRRAALLSAGFMKELIGVSEETAGAALPQALKSMREQYAANGGQLVANEGDLGTLGVSLLDVLNSSVSAAQNSALTVPAADATALSSERELARQRAPGELTDGKPSPGFPESERTRAVALATDLRNIVTALQDTEISKDALSPELQDALSVAGDDSSLLVSIVKEMSMDIADAVERFRDGEASPVVSGSTSVTLRNGPMGSGSEGITQFSASRTVDGMSVTLQGNTSGEFAHLTETAGVKSTRVTLDMTASVASPTLNGEISEAKVAITYSEMNSSVTVRAGLDSIDPSIVLIPPLDTASFVNKDIAVADLALNLKVRLAQVAQAGIDPVTLFGELRLTGTNLKSFDHQTASEVSCASLDPLPPSFVSHCFRSLLQDGVSFDALQLAISAKVTSAAGKTLSIGTVADLQGAGTQVLRHSEVIGSGVVRYASAADAIRSLGVALGSQGTQFCCFDGIANPFFGTTANGVEVKEDATRFLAGTASATLETNVPPLDPRTRIHVNIARSSFDSAAVSVSVVYGGRRVDAELRTDTLSAGRDKVVRLSVSNPDGVRITGTIDPATDARIDDGEIRVNGRLLGRIEERAGALVAVFNDGTLQSLQ